jgi:hypothetical protein
MSQGEPTAQAALQYAPCPYCGARIATLCLLCPHCERAIESGNGLEPAAPRGLGCLANLAASGFVVLFLWLLAGVLFVARDGWLWLLALLADLLATGLLSVTYRFFCNQGELRRGDVGPVLLGVLVINGGLVVALLALAAVAWVFVTF